MNEGENKGKETMAMTEERLFIVDMRENTTRGRGSWESPE